MAKLKACKRFLRASPHTPSGISMRKTARFTAGDNEDSGHAPPSTMLFAGSKVIFPERNSREAKSAGWNRCPNDVPVGGLRPADQFDDRLSRFGWP